VAAPPADPLFDRPYEPQGAAPEPAVWERGAPPPPAARGVAPNIKPKKAVAALLGGRKG
jgi:hypothetical protein